MNTQLEQMQQELLNSVRDNTIKDILFGMDAEEGGRRLLTRNIGVLTYMSNLIILWFHFLYLRYRRQLARLDEESVGNAERREKEKEMNLSRVLRGFGKLYIFRQLNYDLIDNIMQDVQVELSLGGHLASAIDTGEMKAVYEYGDLAYYAKKTRDGRRVNFDSELKSLVEKFLKVFDGCSFISKLGTSFRTEEAVYYSHGVKKDVRNLQFIDLSYGLFLNKAVLPSYDCLIKFNRKYYYLSDIEFMMSDGKILSATPGRRIDFDNMTGLKANYHAFGGGKDILSVIISDDETLQQGNYGKNVFFLNESAREYGGENFTSGALEDLTRDSGTPEDFYSVYSINYKYIRNLARAVADILNGNSKRDLRERYASDERFSNLFNIGEEVVHWDVIVAIIMVQEGAKKLLEIVFSADEESFSNLMKNLETRFGKDNFSREIDIESRINSAVKPEWGKVVGKAMRVEVQVRTLLDCINRAVYGNEEERSDGTSFPLSIRSRLQWLEDLKKETGKTPAQRLELTRTIVLETLATLIAFYEGLYGYMQKKEAFETESRYRVMKEREVKRAQTAAQNDYDEVFTKTRDALMEQADHKKIFGALRKLCEKYLPGEEYYKMLRNELGRSQLMDCNYIEGTLMCCWEAEPDKADGQVLARIIDNVEKVFRYLQSGIRGDSGGDYYDDGKLPLSAIFPYIATYQYDKQTGEGYHISNFSIISPLGRDCNIMVLSEFKYKLNEKYYCLPNMLSSVEDMGLWIEPVAIYCSGKNET